MPKQNSKTAATRLSLDELAKCRDGLIARGIEEKDLQTVSQIIRFAVYLTILNCKQPKEPASQESTDFIAQLWSQTKTSKTSKNITLDKFTEQ